MINFNINKYTHVTHAYMYTHHAHTFIYMEFASMLSVLCSFFLYNFFRNAVKKKTVPQGKDQAVTPLKPVVKLTSNANTRRGHENNREIKGKIKMFHAEDTRFKTVI